MKAHSAFSKRWFRAKPKGEWGLSDREAQYRFRNEPYTVAIKEIADRMLEDLRKLVELAKEENLDVQPLQNLIDDRRYSNVARAENCLRQLLGLDAVS